MNLFLCFFLVFFINSLLNWQQMKCDIKSFRIDAQYSPYWSVIKALKTNTDCLSIYLVLSGINKKHTWTIVRFPNCISKKTLKALKPF